MSGPSANKWQVEFDPWAPVHRECSSYRNLWDRAFLLLVFAWISPTWGSSRPFNPASPALVASTFSVSFILLWSFLFACACQPLTFYTIYLLCVPCVLMSLTPPPVWVGLFALFIGCIANAEISASYLMGPQYIVVDWVSMINIYLLVIVFRLWWFLLLYTSDNEYYENNDTWNWPEVTGQASWRRWHLNWL